MAGSPLPERRHGRRRPRFPDSEPLPLLLPSPPALPGRIRPEAAVPCAFAFDHPEFRFSIDWDGARSLLFVSADGVRLQAETLVDVSDRFPEIIAATAALQGRAMVLDGVVAVLDPTGCPDIAALGERQVLGAAGRQRLPTVFLATDILHLDGVATMSMPLDRRLELLRAMKPGDARIQIPEWVAGQGEALAEAAAQRQLPGLLARRGDARYHPGIASPHRLHLALAARADCPVVDSQRVDSQQRHCRLRLGEYRDGRIVAAGVVEIAESSTMWRWAAPGGRLRRGIVATVSHGGRHPDGSLRSPALITLRDDLDPLWCVRRDPVTPPRTQRAEPAGFRPTVLSALPLGPPA